MKKLLSFLFLFATIFFLYSGGKKVFLNATKSITRRDIEEKLVEDTYEVVLKQEEPSVDNVALKEINVPYYWKRKSSLTESDYLKGYIPSIQEFVKYIKGRDRMIYGTLHQGNEIFSREDILPVLVEENVIFADGIKNENSYFDWNEEDCFYIEKGFKGNNLFICRNWVNWMHREVTNPIFVLTDCYINKSKGKCVFLDYSNLYFSEKKLTDTRCFSEEYIDLCDFQEYKKYINYK